ncbi:hypothetical protein PLESTB_000668600 [Pleodorina starrii]|uniref:Uncharacterized protein n=1 Tax=Pleodorina starrii TaxID=330485 RepID=A0A9W6BIJ8_9CHLO|nr:hypothetical protein PLESTM_001669400 [Pleodorina starrii]GLC52789.1 hypothetical protein PLESTB_000668600 [Pleodorina starrii]GLC65866.1 hypothetical protein PLESTF_000352000 [Pleodorina starrii]
MEQPAAHEPAAGSIKPINRQSIHRICSGQVILDLATAIKELVENALDAGATNIEVRLREYGSLLVEVADNGRGVPPADYQALTLKYHTSKITSFDDLTSVSTYGFRGEALSSLCAVSELSVVTRTAEQAAGVRLEYDHEGHLTGRSAAPRAVGTTVAVKNLFATLPVRHKEFLRNLKREFARAVSVLQAYALISTHARLIVTNQAGKGAARTTVFTTAAPAPAYEAYVTTAAASGGGGGSGSAASLPGCLGAVLASAAGAAAAAAAADPRVAAELAALRDNVVAVFGGRVAESLEALVLPEDAETGVRVVGWVSRAGCGLRGDASRQFIFLNGRPVDLPKAARVLNDSFKSLSSPAHAASCRPMALLAVTLAASDVDVNVTPDKRRVFMAAEDRLTTLLGQALHALWEPSRCTFAVNQPLTQAGTAGGGGGGSLLVTAPQRGGARQQQLNVLRRPATATAAAAAAAGSTADDGGDGAADGAEPDAAAGHGRRAAKRARVTSPGSGGGGGGESPPGAPASAALEPSPRAGAAATAPPAPAPFRHPFLSMLSGFSAAAGKGRVSEERGTDRSPVAAAAAAEAEAADGPAWRREPRRPQRNAGAVGAGEEEEGGAAAAAATAAGDDDEVFAESTPGEAVGGVAASHPDAVGEEEGGVGEEEGGRGRDVRMAEVLPGVGVGAGIRVKEEVEEEEEREGGEGKAHIKAEEAEEEREQEGFEPGLPAAVAGQGGSGSFTVASAGLTAAAPSSSSYGSGAPAAAAAVLRLEPGQLAELTAARVRHLRAQQEQQQRRRQEKEEAEAADAADRRFRSSSLQDQDASGGGAAAVEDGGGGGGGTRAEREAAAERELERVFRKHQFREMRVIGQFNLGFILARHGPDVFIVDQHAAAEKTTFERLQRTVRLTRQPLLAPLQLPPGRLLPVDQLLIREHIDVFRRNGFDFVERRPDGRLVPLQAQAPPALGDVGPSARGSGTAREAQEGEAEEAMQIDEDRTAGSSGGGGEAAAAAAAMAAAPGQKRRSREEGEGEGWAADDDEGDGGGLSGGGGADDGAHGDGGGGGELLLSSVPVSKATGQLGMDDVVELVGMLRAGEGGPGRGLPGGGGGGGGAGGGGGGAEAAAERQRAWEEELRPSRIRAMLASRACRSSVMVGRPLSRGEMRRLLDGLAALRQPWNCPHGRPTMRHVCVLPQQAGLPPA